jgi:hypothetical protein
MIEVKHSAGEEWVVSMKSTVTTHHRVRVTPQDVGRFASGQSTEVLLQGSFRFLLEREPNAFILPSFDLPVIGRYFPEYDREIRIRLQRAEYLASRGIVPAFSVWMPPPGSVSAERQPPGLDYYRQARKEFARLYKTYNLTPQGAPAGSHVSLCRDIYRNLDAVLAE